MSVASVRGSGGCCERWCQGVAVNAGAGAEGWGWG